MHECVVGSDIGGTFTDVVLAAPDGTLHVAKCLTTHDDPTDGLLEGVRRVLRDAGIAPGAVDRFVHGTTLATNVILERRGVDVAFVTTAGFGDMLTLGRQARVEEERYDLFFTPLASPVPPWRCFEVTGRLEPDGSVARPLDEDDARATARRIASVGAQAVAVCLLHSYANPVHEQRVAEICRAALPEGTPIVVSSDVWPEMREYERATTTVMSAYVGPVMVRYLTRLHERLAADGVTAPVQVMDSAGGVMTAAMAAQRAVYTIESGPAAGVVAAQQVGRRCGEADLISFDMGGTTAKAGIVRDGRPEIVHEFAVGGKGSFGGRRAGTGVPIKAPAIDLAEVGAGGGSVAWVDAGGTLRVGPHSAGSEPGPACYGRGGTEPTVTDADLVLGYLNPDTFAGGTLMLDRGLAEAAVATGLARPLGVEPVAAAAAVHDVANANMGAAVHVVTVQRGLDPRHFALVALGGAAPAHIARIATQFDIAHVLVPDRAGVGSAVGLLEADLSVTRARTVLCATDDAEPLRIETTLGELTSAALGDLGISGNGAPELSVVRSVDLRYRGQAHELTIDLPQGPVTEDVIGGAVDRFYARYLALYGIDLHAPTELVNARVRVTVQRGAARTAGDSGDKALGVRREPPAMGARPAWFEELGGFVETPVHWRPDLRPGDVLAGPSLVDSPESTLVVPPAWSAVMDGERTIRLEQDGRTLPVSPTERVTALTSTTAATGATATAAPAPAAEPADDLEAAVLRHALLVVVEEASIVVVRSAYSTFIVEGSDASAAILDVSGRLVASSVSTSLSHSASLRSSFGAVLERFPLAVMAPGDDVYRGGIHANDLLVFRPVFVEGRPTYVTGVLIHVADLSGLSAGGMAADATDIFLEGLQLPAVKLVAAGVPVDDTLAILAANSRQPENLLGDVRALVAGAHVAAVRLEALVEEHGAERLAAGVADFIAHTEAAVRRELAAIPRGTYRSEYPMEGIDRVGLGGTAGTDLVTRHWIRVAVTVSGDRATVDFTGTDPQVAAPLNSGASQTMSGVIYALRCFLDPTIPMNEGCFLPFDIVIPPGTLLNVEWPFPGGGRFIPVAAAEEAIIQALSQARPDRAVSPSGILQPFSIDGGASAPRPWLHMAFDHGGMGARRGSDGPDASGSLFGLGRNIVPQVEPIEAKMPLRVESVALIPDSGGPGRWRGGLGTRTVIRALVDANVDTRGDRLDRPPPGSGGGGPGRGGGYYRRRVDGTLVKLPAKATRQRLAAGEALVVETSGGGGLGPVEHRDPTEVRLDVASGRVSIEGARRHYGVPVDGSPPRRAGATTAEVSEHPLERRGE